MNSLVANDPKTNNNTKATTTTKAKAPTLKYFLGHSDFNINVGDNLVATGKVTEENLGRVLKREDLLLSECNGKSLVIAAVASNGLIKNIGYFSANNSEKELFDGDAEEAYKVIKKNADNLILAVSNDDFIASW